mmetsp:Transcript_50745/g.110806  ORF Transcript_50745/g.110806 Transcript_50745/m.110806 type:complete len:235 (+) Transcript_50745:75-779(+)
MLVRKQLPRRPASSHVAALGLLRGVATCWHRRCPATKSQETKAAGPCPLRRGPSGCALLHKLVCHQARPQTSPQGRWPREPRRYSLVARKPWPLGQVTRWPQHVPSGRSAPSARAKSVATSARLCSGGLPAPTARPSLPRPGRCCVRLARAWWAKRRPRVRRATRATRPQPLTARPGSRALPQRRRPRCGALRPRGDWRSCAQPWALQEAWWAMWRWPMWKRASLRAVILCLLG